MRPDLRYPDLPVSAKISQNMMYPQTPECVEYLRQSAVEADEDSKIEVIYAKNFIIDAIQRKKRSQYKGFMHRALTFLFESFLPIEQQRRRIALSERPRCFWIEVCDGGFLAEEFKYTVEDSRALEILQSQSNSVFQEVDGPLEEFTAEEIEVIYSRLIEGRYPWEEINAVIKARYREGCLNMTDRKKWDHLYDIYTGHCPISDGCGFRFDDSGITVMGDRELEVEQEVKRKIVCCLILWIVAVDSRWGFDGAEKVVKSLDREVLTLTWQDFVYKLHVV